MTCISYHVSILIDSKLESMTQVIERGKILKTLRESLIEDRIAEISTEVKLQSKRKRSAEEALKRINSRLEELHQEWNEMDIELKHHQYKRGAL
ncbi:hypothetical protein Novomoskovsk_75 [Bacillus phage Novomoskovsk]|uniref:Uncharacterized protein n=1 Tax=Bacillus phage Novomoskovsk TaxID=2736258 RepID=A0A6M9Z737_9CAUD|nr:hypothetical protein Novomoskovsk_75 [Bacillus phage Novomoskovsk]